MDLVFIKFFQSDNIEADEDTLLHWMPNPFYSISALLKLYTYDSILLHPGFHLLHLPRHHPGKNGRVCPLTEQQVFSWDPTNKHKNKKNTVRSI